MSWGPCVGVLGRFFVPLLHLVGILFPNMDISFAFLCFVNEKTVVLNIKQANIPDKYFTMR